jgi:hypothetical protein
MEREERSDEGEEDGENDEHADPPSHRQVLQMMQ